MSIISYNVRDVFRTQSIIKEFLRLGSECASGYIIDVNVNNNNSNCKKKELPKPRSAGSIQVNFTPRMLATPARESKLPEEEIVCYIYILYYRFL